MKPITICLCLAVLAGCGGSGEVTQEPAATIAGDEAMLQVLLNAAVRDRDNANQRYDALLKSLTEAEAAGALDSFDVSKWRGPFPSSVTDGTAFFWKKSGSSQHYISTRPATPEEIEIYSQESTHHEQ